MIARSMAPSRFPGPADGPQNLTYDLDFLPRALLPRPRRLTEGWQLGGIYTGASGLPITPFLSVDVSGTGELNDRPNLVADPNSGAPRDAAQFFNKGAFARPADGTFGSAGRNTITGPRKRLVRGIERWNPAALRGACRGFNRSHHEKSS